MNNNLNTLSLASSLSSGSVGRDRAPQQQPLLFKQQAPARLVPSLRAAGTTAFAATTLLSSASAAEFAGPGSAASAAASKRTVAESQAAADPSAEPIVLLEPGSVSAGGRRVFKSADTGQLRRVFSRRKHLAKATVPKAVLRARVPLTSGFLNVRRQPEGDVSGGLSGWETRYATLVGGGDGPDAAPPALNLHHVFADGKPSNLRVGREPEASIALSGATIFLPTARLTGGTEVFSLASGGCALCVELLSATGIMARDRGKSSDPFGLVGIRAVRKAEDDSDSDGGDGGADTDAGAPSEGGSEPAVNEALLSTMASVLEHALKRQPHHPSWARLFAAADRDGSGRLEFGEFLGLVRRPPAPHARSPPGLGLDASRLSDAHLRALWDLADADGGGDLAAGEFANFVKSCKKAALPPESRATVCGPEKRTRTRKGTVAPSWEGDPPVVFRGVDAKDVAGLVLHVKLLDEDPVVNGGGAGTATDGDDGLGLLTLPLAGLTFANPLDATLDLTPLLGYGMTEDPTAPPGLGALRVRVSLATGGHLLAAVVYPESADGITSARAGAAPRVDSLKPTVELDEFNGWLAGLQRHGGVRLRGAVPSTVNGLLEPQLTCAFCGLAGKPPWVRLPRKVCMVAPQLDVAELSCDRCATRNGVNRMRELHANVKKPRRPVGKAVCRTEMRRDWAVAPARAEAAFQFGGEGPGGA